jgi:hypothetical protein
MKTFEQFQVNEAKGSEFAMRLKRVAKWQEGVKLPFDSLRDIASSVNSEKDDVSSLVTWFRNAMGINKATYLSVYDMGAKMIGDELLEVDFQYEIGDRRDDGKSTVMITQ